MKIHTPLTKNIYYIKQKNLLYIVQMPTITNLSAYFNMQKKLLILVQMPPKTNSKYQLKIVLGICEVRTRILKKLMFFLF